MIISTSNYGGWLGHSAGTGGANLSKVVTLCVSLMISTGTAAKPDDSILFKEQNSDTRFARSLVSVAEESSCAEELEKVLSVFSPSISELAKVFGVSRQTLYNWKNGESLSAENEKKLRSMGAAADLFAHVKISVTGSILKRKIFENKTLFEIARDANSSFYAAAEILVSRLVKEREQQSRLASRFANRRQRAESGDSDFIDLNDRS
jgi:transcriptional regulator with XRE-family HTH domain